MARFLVDEMLPPTVASRLCDDGHGAVDIHQAGLQGAPDSQVFAHAYAESRILITADLGFANVLQYPPGSHPGIVVVRLPSELPAPLLVDRIVEVIRKTEDADLIGAIVVIEPAGVRRRGP